MPTPTAADRQVRLRRRLPRERRGRPGAWRPRTTARRAAACASGPARKSSTSEL